MIIFFSILLLLKTAYISAQCTNGDLELVSFGNDSDHLMICANSQKYQLCSTGFNESNARVACRQLGFVEGRFLGNGTKQRRFDFLNVTYVCANGSEIQLTNGGCSNVTSSNCASNRSVRIQCYNSFLSFVSSNRASVPVSASLARTAFEMSTAVPIGQSNITNGYIYPFGVISFGNPPLTDNQLRAIPSYNFREHPVNVIAPFLVPTLSLRLQIEGGLFSDRSKTQPFTVVNRFIRNRTDEGFEAESILIVDWEEINLNKKSFQVIIASDLQTTYAIFTYYCEARLRSVPSSAFIGYSLSNYSTEKFRYSETPYSHEIACLNTDAGVDYYNLLYKLTGAVENDTSNTGSTCAEAGLLTGCCQPFNDPTRSCRVTRSNNNNDRCYCDSLCYRYGDCCSDVGRNGLGKPCVPVCQIGTVNQEGNKYFTSGPTSICENGLQRYIQSGSAAGITTTTKGVICQQILDQTTRATLVAKDSQNIRQFFIDRLNVNCVGIERTVQECTSYNISIHQASSATSINCQALIQRNRSDCTNGNVRLHGGTMGRLEICVTGKWRPVCSSTVLRRIETSLMCSLSGNRPNSSTSVSAIALNQTPVVIITTLMCPLGASRLSNCTVMTGQCSTGMEAHIDCNASSPTVPPRPTSSMIGPTSPAYPGPRAPSSTVSLSVSAIGGIAGTAIIVSLIVAIIVIIIIIFAVIYKRKSATKNHREIERSPSQDKSLDSFDVAESSRYVHDAVFRINSFDTKKVTVNTDLTKNFQSDGLIVDYNKLRLLDSIGRGEFGLVYRAHLFDDQGLPIDVAVKTLKGTYNQEDIDDLLVESLKMKKLSHSNAMSLIGVCLDAGPAPFIILPYMAGGSLLSYLKRNRKTLVLKGDEKDEGQKIEIKLLSMSLQIAKGMEYITSKNMIHRDLAARNCMIDHEGIIKVSDFGLSKSLYEKMYFRQEKSEGVKLPIKWMAIESIDDGLFSEKSDVWSFGVTCWEIFSGGKGPYGGISPLTLLNLLEEEHRLNKPINNACSESTYELLMSKCWDVSPEKRPTFSDLVTNIENTLTSMADYLDFNQFKLKENDEETKHE